MPVIRVPFPCEPLGHYDFLEVDGRRFASPFDEQALRNIPNLKLRDDDVIICGYMRSGTHWMFEIATMLLTGRVETVPIRKESLHLEQANQEQLDSFQSPRVLSSHLLFDQLPAEVRGRKTKVIYLMRDPRDCLVSWHTCLSKIIRSRIPGWRMSFSDFMRLSNNEEMEWSSWFENVLSWEVSMEQHPDHPVHIIYYEQLRQNPGAEIARLAEYLGAGRSAEFCERVAEKTSLDKMVKDKDPYTEKWSGRSVHYNKGVVGNWKAVFTVKDMEDFDSQYEEKMSDSRFKQRYSRRS